MENNILDFYKQTSMYTYAGAYSDLYKSLPDDIKQLRSLICDQHIHKIGVYGAYCKNDKTVIDEIDWREYRCKDDILLTSSAMTAELLRINSSGFILNKPIRERLILTCRYLAVWFASILKSKDIPCRCRSGFAPYVSPTCIVDHWITEYWSSSENRWVLVDAEDFENDVEDLTVNLCDVDPVKWMFPAALWLEYRKNGVKNIDTEKLNMYHSRKDGELIAWALFMDFHAVMNDEISYRFVPTFISDNKFGTLDESKLKEIDNLAELMLDIDKNFVKLQELFETNKDFRVLNSPLVSTWLHKEI